MKRVYKGTMIIPLLLAVVVSALWATDALRIGPTGEVTINGNLTVQGEVRDARGLVMPTGSIIAFAGITAPEGWRICNGDEISKLDHPELYEVIGDSWGSGYAGTWQVTTPRTGANGQVRSGNETRPFSAGVNYIIKL